ncbi:uncharacterized protein LOC141914542 [Tubulanus polymorphus]|uniref:uncharacterized protein LOC141914542 n=1 Tax=Tubulanus polymorphus TaxID=672921 RepID=UPI003DA69AE8
MDSLIPIVLVLLSLTCTHANNYQNVVYMDQSCGQTIRTDQYPVRAGILKLTSKAAYDRNMDCNVTLQAPANSHVSIYITDISVTPGPAFTSPPCLTDKLDVLENNVKKPLLPNGICGSTATALDTNHRFVRSDLNNLQLKFTSSAAGTSGTGFTIVFTQFAIRTGDCLTSEFQCGIGADLACINKLLKCDGEINCKDGTDEFINGKKCAEMLPCETAAAGEDNGGGQCKAPPTTTCYEAMIGFGVAVGLDILLLILVFVFCAKWRQAVYSYQLEHDQRLNEEGKRWQWSGDAPTLESLVY